MLALNYLLLLEGPWRSLSLHRPRKVEGDEVGKWRGKKRRKVRRAFLFLKRVDMRYKLYTFALSTSRLAIRLTFSSSASDLNTRSGCEGVEYLGYV